jgi:hypothetical protein
MFQLKDKQSGIVLISIAVIALGLLSYTAYRAALLSFTHDESLTYNIYLQQHAGFNDIIAMRYPTANNHILNTLLMKYCILGFGNSELSLRLPNVLAHMVFMLFSALWLLRFRNMFFIIAGFIILNVNPYMLDFFSVARGYGIAIAFMMVSVYCFFRYADHKRKWNMVCALLACFFAVAANLALLHFFVGLLLVFNICFLVDLYEGPGLIKDKFIRWLKMNIPLLVAVIANIAFLYEPVRRLIEGNELYFGGKTGIWTDTVNTLIESYLLNSEHPLLFYIVKTVFIGFYIGGLIYLLFFIISKFKGIENKNIVYTFILFIVPAYSTIIQHYVLGSNFLMVRTALFFMPLFFMYVIALTGNFKPVRWRQYLSASFVTVIVLFTLYNGIVHYNLTRTSEWAYDASDRDAIDFIAKDAAIHHKGEIVSAGISWQAEPSMNFYRNTRDYQWLRELKRHDIVAGHEYYFVAVADTSALPHIPLRLLAHYPDTWTYLYAANQDSAGTRLR